MTSANSLPRVLERRPTSFVVFSTLCLLLLVGLWFHGPQMTSDSQVIWRQASGELGWSNHHPWPYTSLARVAYLLAGDSGQKLLVAFQCIAVAAAFTRLQSVLARLWRLGVWPAVSAAMLCLPGFWAPRASLGVASFASFMWKDVLFFAAAVWLAAVVTKEVGSAALGRANPGFTWRSSLEIATASFAMSLFRWNGFVAACLAIVISALWFPAGRRIRVAALGLAGAAIGVTVLLSGPLMGISPMMPRHANAAQLSDLTWLVREDLGEVNAATQQLMAEVAPLVEWSAMGKRSCESVDRVVYDLAQSQPGRAEAMDRVADDLAEQWVSQLGAHWREYAQVRLCRLAPLIAPVEYVSGLPVLSWGRLLSRGLPVLWILGASVVVAGLVNPGRRWASVIVTVSVPIAILASYAVQPYAADVRYYLASIYIGVFFASAWSLAWMALTVDRWRRTRGSGPLPSTRGVASSEGLFIRPPAKSSGYPPGSSS